jgi:hypothetical protein
MSVVVVTDHYTTIRRVLDALRSQTVRDHLEIVIVVPEGGKPGLDADAVRGFAAVRIVGVPDIRPMSSARAAGVRASTAPIVFIGETHSFPGPGFAESILAAHTEDWDAVVPGLSNANPETSFSWASFLMDYGTWFDELPSGQIPGGPTWNVAYKRSVLLGFGDALDSALSHGDEFAVAFHARGHRTYFQPSAKLGHANVSQARWWFEQRFLAGLLVAAGRRRRWSWRKRLLYVFASPLIPAVVLYRIMKPARYLARRGKLPRGTALVLLAGVVTRTAGEVVGYVRGVAAGSQSRMDEYELHKLKFTSMAP